MLDAGGMLNMWPEGLKGQESAEEFKKAPKPKWNLCGGDIGSCGATPSALMEETGKDARLVGSGEGIP